MTIPNLFVVIPFYIKMKRIDTKYVFLWKSLVRGLISFAIIITTYILVKGEISVYQSQINDLGDRLPLLLSIFSVSEVAFGIIPPELFMLIWQSKGMLSEYILNLSYLAVISYGAGIIGYYLGYFFSKTNFFRQIQMKYFQQYNRKIKRYGLYLVFIGAVTPVPFSATCMLAGSVNTSFKHFLLVTISRILRFIVYGWMVWSFPNWF